MNGQAAGVDAEAGSYAALKRQWTSGDTVTVKLPMELRTVPAADNPSIAAVAYGPAILSGNYGTSSLTSSPQLDLSSVRRTGASNLAFTATVRWQGGQPGSFL